MQGTWSKIKNHPLRDGNTKLIKFYDMTNFDKELLSEWGRATAAAAIAFIMLALACLMCGCRTQYVPVETVRTEYREADTTAIYNRMKSIFESKREKTSRVDSLVDRIKETVVLNEQGDTTRHDKVRIVYKATAREKELEVENKTLQDSISVLNTRLESIQTDSVPLIVPVERKLSTWEKAKMNFGGIAFGGMIVAVAVIAVLAWLARKRRK